MWMCLLRSSLPSGSLWLVIVAFACLYILGGALSLNLPLRGVSSLYISSSFFSFLKIISMSTDLRHLTGYLLEPGAVGDRAVMKV